MTIDNGHLIRTLIVEDSAPTRKIIASRMQTLGCMIVGEAEDPAAGLRAFHELDPQLVTLDLVMPQVNNLSSEALFSIIRKEKPETAVIVISAIKTAAGASLLARGALAYIEKPFLDFEQLQKKLEVAFPQLKQKSKWAADLSKEGRTP